MGVRDHHMRKAVLIPLAIGLILLAVGVVQAYSSLQKSPFLTIPTHGFIRNPEEPQPQQTSKPQQTSPTTQLDILGFLIIIASLEFLTIAYINNRNSYREKKLTVA